MRRVWKAAIASVLVAFFTADSVASQTTGVPTDLVIEPMPESAEIRAALIAAVGMLPKAPMRIAVMDVAAARSGVREHLLTLDAFIVEGNAVIYVVQQSELLRRARTGARVYCAMLASVLWHEMAHLAGSDERAARRAEEDLWTRMVRDGVVDTQIGLRYLKELKRRPDDYRLRAEIPDREYFPSLVHDLAGLQYFIRRTPSDAFRHVRLRPEADHARPNKGH